MVCLGELLLDQGQPAEARKLFEEALAEHSGASSARRTTRRS